MRLISTGSGGSIDVSSGNFNVLTSGTSKLAILNNGNVGIGTQNPNSLLNVGGEGVNGSGLINGISMKVNSSSTADRRNFSVGQGDNSNVFLNWAHNSITANAYAVLETWSNSNPLILQSTSGRVGIGTTSPSEKFVVSNSSNNYAIGQSYQKMITDSTLASYFAFGTSNLDNPLGGIEARTSSNPSIAIGVCRDSNNRASIHMDYLNNIRFFTNNVGRMFINNNGDVGIGTDVSPSQKLQVNGNILAFGNDASLFVGGNTSSGESGIRLVSFDNIGFMDIKGTSINFRVDNTNGASQRMTILSNGRVGINTSTPSETLNVNGNILATGSITPSDERIKENIVNANTDDNLNHILAIQVKHYDYTDNYVEYCNKDDTPNYGFIAQQVEQVIPNAVKTVPFTISTQLEDGTFETIQHWDDFKIVQKDLIFTEAVGAIQELHKIIQAQKAQIEALELTNLAQEETISNILERLEALEVC